MAKAFSIAIDSLSLLSQLTGIGRYTYEISKHLQKSPDFKVTFYYGYFSKLIQNPAQDSKIKGVKSILSKNRLTKKIARKLLTIFSKFLYQNFDIYWQPNIIPNPNVKAKKVVATLHDFSFMHYRESHPKERLDYFDENFLKEISKATHIITGSNYTKNEIIKYLDFNKSDISVIYHGINHALYKLYTQKEIEKTKQKFNLPQNFLLFVGSIEPRKNMLRLLKAYNLLSKEIQNDFPLVLVGFKGWENEEIMQEIEKSNHILYLGYIDDLELTHIYNLATIFIYPSLYEGFGLPPLEAMACGTPVIVSSSSSMPEVCGDSALYIDPLNYKDIYQKLLLLLEDKSLQDTLRGRGLKRVKGFSWEKSAQEHIRLFKSI